MHQLQRINHRHEQIINWLLANPDKPLGECARHFGYSQPWLSQVVHSDMFQVAYRRRAEALGQLVVHTLNNELTGLASLAIQKSVEQLQKPSCGEEFLQKTTNTVLSALGFSSKQNPTLLVKQAGAEQHLHVHVDAETLRSARERASARLIQEGAPA